MDGNDGQEKNRMWSNYGGDHLWFFLKWFSSLLIWFWVLSNSCLLGLWEIVWGSHMVRKGGFDEGCHWPPELSGQGTDALNVDLWSPERRLVELWSLHSDCKTDKDSQRQSEPPAAWHDRPLDPLPHWHWQHCVTHTQATNNNLTAVWYPFDPRGEGLFWFFCAHPANWKS